VISFHPLAAVALMQAVPGPPIVPHVDGSPARADPEIGAPEKAMAYVVIP